MAATLLSRYLDPEVLGRIAGRRFEPRGLVLGNLAGGHRSPAAGFAVEFAGHREYVPGDDPKHIDWRVYHRRGRYFIKQYEMETNLVCHFMLDVSRSMRYGSGSQQKLAYAAGLIATLGYAILRQSDKVALATFDEAVRTVVPPSNAMAQIVRITESLAGENANGKTQMADCVLELAGRTRRREIVMIFSDFFTDLEFLEPALQRLRYQQHEVILFQTMHHDELEFDLDETTKFIGLEDADELTAQPEEVRAAYLAAMRHFNDELETMCQRNRIERVLVDTSRDAGSVLVDYLNHRSRLNRGR